MGRMPARGGGLGGLSELLASPALARLVLHFALHGHEPHHVRGLQRRSGLSMSSLNRELRRLEGRGLVIRELDRGRAYYEAVGNHPAWRTLRQLIRDFAEPAEVVEAAIAGIDGIDAAFVYDSFARGDPRDDSDVDVLVVGDVAEDAALGRQAAEASVLLGRPVEVRSYTPERLRKQIASGNAGAAPHP